MKSKLFNKVFAALLSLMLTVGLLQTTVFAANIATVKINGQELQNDVPVQCGEGTAVLDKENSTLTLNNVTINQETTSPVIDIRTGELKIILIGENKVLSDDKRPFYGQSADITIQGTQADSLTVETNADGIQADQSNLTVDGCNIRVTSTTRGGLMCWGGILTIQNEANITVDSYDLSVVGEDGISITDSMVNATSNGDGTNVINSSGDISIDNSIVTATGTSEKAYPAIYAAGNVDVTNKSNVTATTEGMRGIFTDSDMTVNDSAVAATGTTHEGMVVVGTLDLTNSKLTASGKPDDNIPAIVTKNFNITNSEVTAKGGFDLFDWSSGEIDSISLSITPANGKLTEFKVDGNNWDGSAAVHFKEGSESPYDSAVNFSADEMNWLGAYRYIHIGEHIHTGGTANCEMSAICDDCGKTYGDINPDYHHYVAKVDAKAATCTEDGNIEYWHCNACGEYFSDEALTKEITKEETVVKATGHKLSKTDAKEATCTEAGNKEYWTCDTCGKHFSDAEGKTEISLSDTVVAAKGHSYVDGKCSVCGVIYSLQTGDSSNIVLWITIMLAAGAALTGTVLYCRKKK